MVLRFDLLGDISSVERTDQGYLRADATLTKVGVFKYLNGDGSIRRELRLPEEVERADALASFELAPLTRGHPTAAGGRRVLLDAGNTGKHQIGTVSSVRADGGFVRGRVQISDQAAIEAAEQGERQLSCGYRCDLEPTRGVTSGIPGIPDGLRFDAIQRNIRGNHVALVPQGRAGKEAEIHMDQADAELVPDVPESERDPASVVALHFEASRFDLAQARDWATKHGFSEGWAAGIGTDTLMLAQRDPVHFRADSLETIELRPGVTATVGVRIDNSKTKPGHGPKEPGMETILIDGVAYEVSQQVAQAHAKQTARHDAAMDELKAAKAEAEAAQARADAAEDKAKQAEAELAKASDPAVVAEAVAARVALEQAATKALGADANFDGLSDAEIKSLVVVELAADKEAAKTKLAECEPAYLEARYDAAIEGLAAKPEPEPEPEPQGNGALARMRQARADADRTDGDELDADAARARMRQHNATAWQQPNRDKGDAH